MAKMKTKELLKDRRVVEEINRHLWIESEKVGHDIGFESAAADWLENFSKAWMGHYMPEKKTSLIKKVSAKSYRSKVKTKSKKFA